VTLIWPDRAIAKQWLQVTVKADGVTGLATPDVFYFGNALGDSGNSLANTFVDGSDFAGSRDNPRNFLNRAPITFAYDYNRDSFVDGTDLALARDNNTNFLTALRLITVPLTPALSPEYRGEGAEGDLTALRLLDLNGLAPVPVPLTPALSPEYRGPMVGSESQPTLTPALSPEYRGEGAERDPTALRLLNLGGGKSSPTPAALAPQAGPSAETATSSENEAGPPALAVSAPHPHPLPGVPGRGGATDPAAAPPPLACGPRTPDAGLGSAMDLSAGPQAADAVFAVPMRDHMPAGSARHAAPNGSSALVADAFRPDAELELDTILEDFAASVDGRWSKNLGHDE
jgi:hypothetical protein